MRKMAVFILAAIIMNCSLYYISADAALEGELSISGNDAIAEEIPADKIESVETDKTPELDQPINAEIQPGTEESVEPEEPDEPEELIGQDEPNEISAEKIESMETDKTPESDSPINAEILPEPEESVEPEEPEQADMIYNVAFPANTVAWLDPENLSGRGQIFSNEYMIENYGNTDVMIRVKNINIYYRSAESIYEFCEAETEDNDSDVHRLNVNIVWVNKSENTEKVLHVTEGECEETVLVLRAAEYDNQGEYVGLNEGSTGFFYFAGTLNANSNAAWEDGEVTVRFDYEIAGAKKERSESISASEEGEAESVQTESQDVQWMPEYEIIDEEDNASLPEINSVQDRQGEGSSESEEGQPDEVGESMIENDAGEEGKDSARKNVAEYIVCGESGSLRRENSNYG